MARDKKGSVLFFQNYAAQDPHAHGRADKKPSGRRKTWRNIPGATQALGASEKLLQLYKNKADFSEVESFLRNDVYKFASGAANKPPGGSLPEYAK